MQAGDLNAAQQAFTQLQNTFRLRQGIQAGTATNATTAGPTAAEPEITLNLGALTPGEQVTIGLNNNAANGSEQITVSLANQHNPTPEQVTFNLQQNTNAQIVLNFLNGTQQTSTRGPV